MSESDDQDDYVYTMVEHWWRSRGTKFGSIYTSMPPEDVRRIVREEIKMRRTMILNFYEEIVMEIFPDTDPKTIPDLREEITQLASINNSVAPVNSLPTELLTMIFSHTGDDLDRATHVCRKWRDIALHAPSLWTHVVHWQTSPEGMETCLNRSKGSPLDVSLTVREFLNTATVRALTTEIHRTRSLRVTFPPSLSLRRLLYDLMSPCPQLKELYIRESGFDHNLIPPIYREYRPDDFDGAPLLHSLTLYCVPLPYLPAGPNVLTHIELIGGDCVGEAPLLLDLLERCPSLETLKICGPFNHRRLALDRRRTVSLPALGYLEMRGQRMTDVGAFLASLMLPPQTRIMLYKETSAWELALADFIPAYNPWNVKLRSLKGLKRLELSWGSEGLALQAHRHSDAFLPPVLKITLHGHERPGERFLANWPIDASHLETLVICGWLHHREDLVGNEISREQWAAMLASVPALKMLRLMSMNRATLKGFVQELAQDRVQLLCGQLETLDLLDVDPWARETLFWNLLKDVVIHRSPAEGGRLNRVELLNAGSTTWSELDYSLFSLLGVRIVQEVDPATEGVVETVAA